MRRAVPDRSRLRGGASLLLALLLCVAGGCGRRSPAAAGAGVPVAGVGVSVAPGSAPPPAAEVAPLADSISNASYPSLEAARTIFGCLWPRGPNPRMSRNGWM